MIEYKEGYYILKGFNLKSIIECDDNLLYYSSMRRVKIQEEERLGQNKRENYPIFYPPVFPNSPYAGLKNFKVEEPINIDYIGSTVINFAQKRNLKYTIILNDITFTSHVFLRGVQGVAINFSKCSFIKGITLEDLDLKTISFNNCENIEELIIKRCNIENLFFTKSITAKALFKESIFSKIQIVDCGQATFTIDAIFKELLIYSIVNVEAIKSIRIMYVSEIKNSTSYISNARIKDLVITGTKIKDNSLILKDLELNNLEINDFSNEGTLRLHNVQFNENSNVKIDNSFLGKAELNNVDFSKAKEFYLSKSNVLDLITTNIKYPKNKDIYKGENEEERRELFRQLKTISSKNREQEQIFEGFELDIQESLTNKWNDKIALFLNRISNSHGQNWLLALAFTFLSSLIFFIFYVISLQNTFDFRLIFNSKGYLLKTPISDYFKYYFEFLNPTHRFNFITDDINLFSSMWDFLGRTFSGYGIYQLIAAFRKHGKKA